MLPKLKITDHVQRPQATRSYPLSKRVINYVRLMTLTEKVALLQGDTDPKPKGQAAYWPGIPRLGVNPVRLTDGPAGIVCHLPATAMPVPLSLASTFSVELARQYGSAIAAEGHALGMDILLSPIVDLVRQPNAGRNFETLGEDPLLSSLLVAQQVTGIQANGMIATVKHFPVHNFESGPMQVRFTVDERTLFEMLLPAFAAAVQAGAGCIMGASSKVNGVLYCENPTFLQKILRQTMGFEGFVMSDGLATHSRVSALKAGLDLEMPELGIRNPRLEPTFGAHLLDYHALGDINDADIDRAVCHILAVMEAFGHLDKPRLRHPYSVSKGKRIAQELAEAGAVLLKNDRAILPLNRHQFADIAWIGPPFGRPVIGGGGSARVIPHHVTSIKDVLKQTYNITNPRVAIGINTDGEPIPKDSIIGLQRKSMTAPRGGSTEVRHALQDTDINFVGATALKNGDAWHWTGQLVTPETGMVGIKVQVAGGTATLTLDQSSPVTAGGLFEGDTSLYKTYLGLSSSTIWVHLKKGKPRAFALHLARDDSGVPDERGAHPAISLRLAWVTPAEQRRTIALAVNAAKSAPVAVVLAYDEGKEGADRTSLVLPEQQMALIEAVAKVNKNTIVVLYTGGPILLPWRRTVPAILQMWYPGQEGASATLRILCGDANPTGRLPVTFPDTATDLPIKTKAQYIGVQGKALHSEGIFVGYRHYDQNNILVAYPFGHGLSYGTVMYSKLTVQDVPLGSEVSFTLRNVGLKATTEVPQIYVDRPERSPVNLPLRWLAGFKRVTLKAGESRRIRIFVPASVWRYYDIQTHAWKRLPGRPFFHVGASSRMLFLK